MKLQKNKGISVGIWSDDYRKLAQWYIDTLGFEVKDQAELSDDSYIAFSFGGDAWFWIGKHDKVSGNNKDPYRIMVEFYVKSVMDTYNELQDKVEIIAEPFPEPTNGGNWCMTIADPEGNILQFYGKK
jgi:predicted enzyme related to lactoylglutathione lyase